MDLYHRIKLRNLRDCGSGENSRSKAVTGSPLAALRAGRRWRENELKANRVFRVFSGLWKEFLRQSFAPNFSSAVVAVDLSSLPPTTPTPSSWTSFYKQFKFFSGLLRWPRTFTIVAPSHRTRQLQFFSSSDELNFFRRERNYCLDQIAWASLHPSIHHPPEAAAASMEE